jgi:hypothetical protein
MWEDSVSVSAGLVRNKLCGTTTLSTVAFAVMTVARTSGELRLTDFALEGVLRDVLNWLLHPHGNNGRICPWICSRHTVRVGNRLRKDSTLSL